MQAIKRGFTLIELLVVIAIIGILAAVVLASLNQARDRGSDASAKTSMASIRSQAEIYYTDNSSSYDGVCADGEVDTLETAVQSQTETAPTCTADADGYTFTATLNNDEIFCVDSTGFSGEAAAMVTNGTTWTDGTHDCNSLTASP